MARQRNDDVGKEGRSSTVKHSDMKNPHGMRTAQHERAMPSKNSKLRHDKDEAGTKSHSGGGGADPSPR